MYDYDAVIFREQVYCLNCTPYVGKKEGCDPIFRNIPWGYTPKCCKCEKAIEVKVVPAPVLSIPKNLHILNTQTLELGEIVQWAFGTFLHGYSYLIRSAEDGKLVIWHDSVISTNINTTRWK